MMKASPNEEYTWTVEVDSKTQTLAFISLQ